MKKEKPEHPVEQRQRWRAPILERGTPILKTSWKTIKENALVFLAIAALVVGYISSYAFIAPSSYRFPSGPTVVLSRYIFYGDQNAISVNSGDSGDWVRFSFDKPVLFDATNYVASQPSSSPKSFPGVSMGVIPFEYYERSDADIRLTIEWGNTEKLGSADLTLKKFPIPYFKDVAESLFLSAAL